MVYTLEHSIEISASIGKVFDAITTKEGIKQWWGMDSDIEPKVNTEAKFGFGAQLCYRVLITDVVVNARLEYKMLECDHFLREMLPTIMVWELWPSDNGDHVVLKVTQPNFADKTEFIEFVREKRQEFLESLRDYCETGVGKPFVGSV